MSRGLLQTLCQKGELDRALDLLSRLDAPISTSIYLSLLKACSIKSKGALTQVKRVHAHLARHSIRLTGLLGDYLVVTLAKCGAVEDARLVSNKLHHLTVFSWTALISAYVDCGRPQEALRMYQCMQDKGLEPSNYTFVALLKACGAIPDLTQGKKFHEDSRRKGFVSDVCIENTLLSMYGKCGAILEAEDVFGAMLQRNLVSWNAMLSAYVEQGQAKQALKLYKHMQEDGVKPSTYTFVTLFKACGSRMDHEHGKIFHALAHREGFASDVFVGNTLVSMYGKCGAIAIAEEVFSAISQHTLVSWNAMLSAYIEQGQGEKALLLYRQMLKEGTSPDQSTFVIALQAAALAGKKEEGQLTKVMSFELTQAFHSDAHRRGFVSDAFVGNTLVSMYGKCKAILEAEDVFHAALFKHDVVSWSAMLSAYAEHGKGKKALWLYIQMQEEGVSPDEQTFVSALQACAILGEKGECNCLEGQSKQVVPLKIGEALHADASKKGYASNVFVGNTIVSMYGKCGAIVEAENVFNALSQRTIVSWSAMISAYVEQGQGEKALWLYTQMQKQCVTMDHVTLMCILQACSATGSLEICKQLHIGIVFAGYDQMPAVAATLIHVYGSCASMVDAQALFDKLLEPDIVSWNACIAGYAGVGNYVASLHMFEKLRRTGTKPNEVTFVSVLSACSHNGLVVKGLEYFESISQDYGLTPDLKHYSSMLDLLGHAGDFRRIEDMLQRMPMEANLTIWLCLLGACHTYGNLELAKRAFDSAVNLQPKQATAYVLMSNIYADAGLHECAAEVENSRLKQGVWREAETRCVEGGWLEPL